MRRIPASLSAVLLAGLTTPFPSAVVAQERIVPPEAEVVYQSVHYAPAVRVANTLYLSGVIGGGGAAEGQFERAFEGLRSVLEAAGADLSDIVEMTTFHVDMSEHIATFMEVKDRYIQEPYPAWTAVGVEQLFSPGALAEIKVIAVTEGG